NLRRQSKQLVAWKFARQHVTGFRKIHCVLPYAQVAIRLNFHLKPPTRGSRRAPLLPTPYSPLPDAKRQRARTETKLTSSCAQTSSSTGLFARFAASAAAIACSGDDTGWKFTSVTTEPSCSLPSASDPVSIDCTITPRTDDGIRIRRRSTSSIALKRTP